MRRTAPSYVRLPKPEAERLDRAAFELKTSKQDLVAPASSPPTATLDIARRVTVETVDDGLAIGHAAFGQPPPDVLTVAELASSAPGRPAGSPTAGRPGRAAGAQARRRVALAREAVLDWLARR